MKYIKEYCELCHERNKKFNVNLLHKNLHKLTFQYLSENGESISGINGNEWNESQPIRCISLVPRMIGSVVPLQ